MNPVWRYTAMILGGAVLLFAVGFNSVRSGLAGRQAPNAQAELRKILQQLGGEGGIADRKRTLAELKVRLEKEKVAHRADAGAFSRRIEETFSELGLTLTSSSEWKPVPKFKVPGAAAFERTFAGTGPFDRLLDAIATLESWPDEARVRALTISREGPGKVAFTLEITAVRALAAKEAG